MKKITQLTQVGKSEKYKLFLEEEFAFFVSLETIYKNNLKIGQKLDEENLKQIKFESDVFFAYTSALNLMASTLKTKSQLNQYLYKKKYDKQVRDIVIEKIESYGYINDKEYAQRYVESVKSQKGVNLIKQQLYLRGVSKSIVSEVLKDFNQEEELEKLVLKFLQNKEKNQITKQKLYRHLLSKGFNVSTAIKMLSKFFKGEDYDWN